MVWAWGSLGLKYRDLGLGPGLRICGCCKLTLKPWGVRMYIECPECSARQSQTKDLRIPVKSKTSIPKAWLRGLARFPMEKKIYG